MSPDFEYQRQLAEYGQKLKVEYAALEPQNKKRLERLKSIDDLNKACENLSKALSTALHRMVEKIIHGMRPRQ